MSSNYFCITVSNFKFCPLKPNALCKWYVLLMVQNYVNIPKNTLNFVKHKNRIKYFRHLFVDSLRIYIYLHEMAACV